MLVHLEKAGQALKEVERREERAGHRQAQGRSQVGWAAEIREPVDSFRQGQEAAPDFRARVPDLSCGGAGQGELEGHLLEVEEGCSGLLEEDAGERRDHVRWALALDGRDQRYPALDLGGPDLCVDLAARVAAEAYRLLQGHKIRGVPQRSASRS